MFNFNWHLFNPRIGLIFMVGCVVVFSIPAPREFSVLAAGVSALLAWLPIIMVPDATRRQHLVGLVVYLLVGCLLTLMAAWLSATEVGLLVSMGVVTFLGYMCLLLGMHSFLNGWCLAYLYLLLPLFVAGGDVQSVLFGHILGVGMVIVLNLLKPVWAIATRRNVKEEEYEASSTEEGEQDSDDDVTTGFAVAFATVVSAVIVAGLGLGHRFLTTDPTLIANATINMISPSLQQTWYSAVERLILGTAGLLGGFYLGWFFPEPWMGIFVLLVSSFLTLALVYVNFGLLVCAMFFLLAYQWGSQQNEAAHLIGNEKLVGEFLGVAMAVVAISILTRLRAWRRKVGSEPGRA